jgi:hypothetical protein
MTSYAKRTPVRPASRQVAHPVWLRRLTVIVLTATLGVALVAPSLAVAAFTRPFIRQLTGTTPSVPFSGPGGIAVDAADNLWVGDGFRSNMLDEFGSSGDLVTTLNIKAFTPPGSLAIERSTGHFYVTGNGTVESFPPYVEVFDNAGAFLGRWGSFGSPAHVVVDNSTGPSAGSVYVASAGNGLYKFNSVGEPLNFAGSASYIRGNQVTGTPNGSFRFDSPKGVAVDSQGSIYAVVNGYGLNGGAVVEYSPSGLFVRAFTGEETPGLMESHENGGFGGDLEGVAVDPVSDHVLVSVSSFFGNEGAVDEFDSSGHFLNEITETEVEVSPGVRQGSRLHSAGEMAVDSHGDLYVVDSRSNETKEHAVDIFGAGHIFPSFRLAEASDRHPTSVALNGSVNPEELPLSDCHFEYVTEAAFKASGETAFSSGGKAPCMPAAGEIPVDTNYHEVQAVISGLVSGTTYRYRLVATTSGALGGTAESGTVAVTAPHAPAIDSTSATNLSSTFADLRAEINPLGDNTTYQFEYVDEAQYHPTAEDPYAAGVTVPTTAADIGSGGPTGSADAGVLVQIGGLTPNTTYHFRVIATNEIGTTTGPDRALTTAPHVVPGLPDNRAYELVTPPNKGSASDMFATTGANHEYANIETGYASESGNDFLLTSTLAAFGSFPASDHNAYRFLRTGTGWQTTALASSSLGDQSVVGGVFNPSDFSRVGINDYVGSYSSATGSRLTALVGPPGGPYMTVHADPPVHGMNPAEEAEGNTQIVGASRDLSHIVLESKNHTLCRGAESQDLGSHALCEWAGDELTFVNVNSEGLPIDRCGAVVGQGHNPGSTHNAVSADGSKVVFTAPDPYAQNAEGAGGCWNGATGNAPQLYMRSGAATIKLSAPEAGVNDPTGRHPAIYAGASEDGSKVFFVTRTELTKDDQWNAPELYEYNTEAPATGRLVRVSRGDLPGGPVEGNVASVPVVSADGSAVYFTAVGRLTSAAPAISGEEVNLYRFDSNTGTTAYVATVEERDYPTEALSGWTGLEVALDPHRDWYTTPDGRYLLFATTRELTGYSTAEATSRDCPPSGGFSPNGHCAEIYRYDSTGGGSLLCVSCNPNGAPPTSNALFARSGSGGLAAGPVRAMSDDGAYVFFDTADALVPQDGNGTLDVYKWHEGRISLVSSGQDFAPSFFLGASADGANVFFGTHARLVPQDTDTAGDIYDARICTPTDPCFKLPPEETEQCEGDACQDPPSSLIDTTPVSLTFVGSGNVAAERKTPVKLTNVQKLTAALKTCRRMSKRQRKRCESQARKRYGKTVKRPGKAKKSSGTGK